MAGCEALFASELSSSKPVCSARCPNILRLGQDEVSIGFVPNSCYMLLLYCPKTCVVLWFQHVPNMLRQLQVFFSVWTFHYTRHQGVHCSSAKVWKLRQQNSGDTPKEWTCWWLPSNSGSSTLKEFQNINPGLIIPSLLIGGLQIYERTLSITILSKSGLGHKKRQVSVTRDFRATIYRCKWLWMSQKTPTLPWSWELWNICTVGKDPTRY